jgi:peptide/nickel transport system substrate-binding protein
MKKYRWQLLIIFLTGIVVGILLLSEKPAPVSVDSPEDIVPVQGGVYSEALIGSFQRLNPLLSTYNDADRAINNLLFSALIKFDDRGLPIGDLAESWGISQDGRFYNFTIRSNSNWHDGAPVTSNDVVFTIELLRAGGMTVPTDLQQFWNDVEVTALDEKNLQFELPEPFSPFLDYLTFKVLPSHLLSSLGYAQILNDDFNLRPVGSGPYYFSKLVVEEDWIAGVELKLNPNYYGSNAFIETLVFLYYPDLASAWQAYQDGIVKGISGLGNGEILEQALQDENLAIYSSRLPQFTTIFLNLESIDAPFLADLAVRRALLMGLNRTKMVNEVFNGQAVVTDSPILPGTWSYYKVADTYEFRPDDAIEMLRSEGYTLVEREGDGKTLRQKDGTFMTLTLLFPDTDAYEQLASMIQENWQALGLEVNLEPVDYDQLVNERLAQRSYQAALLNINLAQTPDPDPYPFWNQVQATTGQNYSQWSNRMASEYLEKARVINDFAERVRLYHNFQVVFNQELPSLILFYPIHNYAISKEIQGVRVGPLFDTADRFLTLPEWYLMATMAN